MHQALTRNVNGVVTNAEIDHCLLSPKLKVIDIRTGADTGSAHRLLLVDLRIVPSA
ncbi:MAG: hypothetical protein LDL41_19920 [Coleofasciculus sp. S288]|nr:hypothetical protein [Coleofasciculus sp. S288]